MADFLVEKNDVSIVCGCVCYALSDEALDRHVSGASRLLSFVNK